MTVFAFHRDASDPRVSGGMLGMLDRGEFDVVHLECDGEELDVSPLRERRPRDP